MKFVYLKEEYILLSKIISEKLIMEKKLKKFINLYLLSLDHKKNIFSKINFEWLIENCQDFDIIQIVKNYSNQDSFFEAKKELTLCVENDIKLIRFEEQRFPEKLKKIEIPPLLLYYKGSFPKDSALENSISIIGSRECYPEYGGKLAYRIGKKVSTEKKWNISGLALGIDSFGHRGSIEGGGYTGAFIAQGLLVPLYPKENIPLEKEILQKKGFIATEYPIFSKPYSKKFILRNRLQAGLVDFLIVPEFNEKSGTLSTIEYGLKEKKTVYICTPKRTLLRNSSCKDFNKGNSLFSFESDKLKEIYSNFSNEDFKKTRLYKIKSNKKYQYLIVERIPNFIKKELSVYKNEKLF